MMILNCFYLKTDASGIGLGAALLQLRDNTACQTHIVPDNTMLCPIAFVSKRCGHIITMHTTQSTKNPPIQGPDHIQTWPRDFHCRLAVRT